VLNVELTGTADTDFHPTKTLLMGASTTFGAAVALIEDSSENMNKK